MRAFLMILLTVAMSHSVLASGLLAPTDESLPPLRVTDHVVDVAIHDEIALTTVTQTFHNDTDRRLEATYVFPLPEEADLTDFQMTFNGKMVQGRVLPAKEARAIYESIVRQAKDPGLIEFIGRRLLQMRVFPIEPKSDTTIEIRYQQVCRPVSGMRAYEFPLRTGRSNGRAYGTLRFAIELNSKAALKSIWSPTHSVEIVRENDHKAKIAYESAGGSLEDDFLLLYDTDSSDLGISVIGYKPKSDEAGHFVLILTPKQLWPEQSDQPQDVVFVLDTSGSMSGEKLEQAKSALRYCIDQLDENDRFSVVRFSTGYDDLFESLQPAGAENRKKAAEWIGRFDASGGTNIADTLPHVMTLRPANTGKDVDETRPFVVVFLTDGQGNREPGEIMAVLASAATELGGAVRIFPFGVGHDVNTILLDRLANTYQGRPTYVQPGENLELVLGDFFSIVSRPVLTDLQLTLPDIGAHDRFPATLGDLYHGQQLIVAGSFDTPVTGMVKLTGVRAGKRVDFVWPSVAFAHTQSATYVPSLWAARKIAYLIDQIREHGENDEMISEVLALSQRYGIQTPYSSWLVDPESSDRIIALGFGAAGQGGGGDLLTQRIEVQRDMLGRIPGGSVAAEALPAPALSVPESGAVLKASGKDANRVARLNAALRDQVSGDSARLDSRRLLRQKIGDRWYSRIGGCLVDAEVDKETEITVVRFGSDAYFELVSARSDLRSALARDRHVVVMLGSSQAVLTADDEGVESFTDQQRHDLGLVRE